MIKQVRLQNFQAHKDTVLEFHPGVNVVAGSSNSGKSSILRAINWLIYNRPSGDAFVSHWARDAKGNQKDDTSIELVMDNHAVERRKSKATKNTYSVDGLMLEAVGLDVPDEVSAALNLMEVNTQRQHDAPFLLSDSPGEVARFFNKIVHFDAIDQYMSLLESKKRKTKSDGANAEQNAERLEADLNKFTWMKEAERIIEKLEVLEDESEECWQDTDTLQEQIKSYLSSEGFLDSANESIKKGTKLVGKIDKCTVSATDVVAKLPALHSTIKSYAEATAIMELAKDVGYAEKVCKKLERKRDLLLDMFGQAEVMDAAVTVYKNTTSALDTLAEELEALKLPDVCPLCGRGD